MAKPVLLTVDDDREVLRAIERDLRRKYGSDYRVLRAGSGPEALEIVRELKIRNSAIALFLIDQRMPGMSGVEFLAQAITLFPDAKRHSHRSSKAFVCWGIAGHLPRTTSKTFWRAIMFRINGSISKQSSLIR